MAGKGERRQRSCQTVAVILLLCSLVPCLTCFSWGGLTKKAKQNKVVSEATEMEGRRGGIFFNEKEFNSQSGFFSLASMGNDDLLNVDLDQFDGTGLSKQASQLEDAKAKEAAWRRLNPSLHCGQNEMKLKAMGPGAANLQLDMGNARPLSLSQVPELCGYSMQQNALGLVLVVPYDGCNVMQENRNYVVRMSWLGTPVKFTCPMMPRPAATPTATTAKPAQLPSQSNFSHETLNRHKRHTNQPHYTYDSYSNYLYYLYYMYMMSSVPPTQKPPVAYPYYPYYQYYPHYPYQPLPGIGDGFDTYYYPIIQHFYEGPPTPTTKPTVSSPTTKPTTKPDSNVPTKPCTTKKPSGYPGPMKPYVSYDDLPFTPYISYKANKAGKIPDQNTQDGYKSGLQTQPEPRPGFNYWQPVPWLPRSKGENDQFDWETPQTKHDLPNGRDHLQV